MLIPVYVDGFFQSRNAQSFSSPSKNSASRPDSSISPDIQAIHRHAFRMDVHGDSGDDVEVHSLVFHFYSYDF